jgi:hypothetical protein
VLDIILKLPIQYWKSHLTLEISLELNPTGNVFSVGHLNNFIVIEEALLARSFLKDIQYF